MTSEALQRELNYLGIDEHTFSVLALLPLVQVAWADGDVQQEERALILKLANEHYHLPPGARDVLDSWLHHPPSEAYLRRGRRALVAIAHSDPNFNLEAGSLEDVLAFSRRVAEASGGLLGFRKVDARERDTLAEIADALAAKGRVVLFDEATDDDATDAFDPQEMQRIREDAGIVHGNDEEEDAEALADLVHHGDMGGSRFQVRASGLTLGRSSRNDVQIPHDHGLSRMHARLVVEEGAILLEDLDTTNGTWVNGERIRRRRLYGAEQIRVGDAHFTFLVR